MKFLVLLCFILDSFGIAKAQTKTDTFSIRIHVSSGNISEGEFVTYIDKKGTDLKIVYAFRDSVSKAYYKSPLVKELIQTSRLYDRTQSNPKLSEIDRILDSLKIKNSYYSKDSLSLNASNNLGFINLLEKIISTPKELLENREATKKVVVLDGANYSFIIETNKEKKYVYAYPFLDPIIHPLLYQLYTEVQNIYRKGKHNNFLGKMKTLSW
jgi:hypothetical protein